MIESVYAILMKEPSEPKGETIFAVNSIHGMNMQAVSSNLETIQTAMQFALKRFPDKEFEIVKFVRGH